MTNLEASSGATDRAKTRVLLIDDEPDYRLVVRGLLAKSSAASFDVEWVATGDEGINRLAAGRHDVCLLDYNLRGTTGLEVLARATAQSSPAPIILLTGQGNVSVDLSAMKAGAAGYLDKGELTAPLLERAIRYAIEQRRTFDALRTESERFQLAVGAADEGIWDWDLDNLEIYYSPQFEALLGLPPGSLRPDLEEWFGRVHPDDLDALMAGINASLEGRVPRLRCEHRVRCADDTYRWVLARGVAVRDRRRGTSRMVGSFADISDRHEEHEVLRRQASEDDLTGLLNHGRLDERLAASFAEARRYGDALAVAVTSVDELTTIGDSLSRGAADAVLRAAADAVRAGLRGTDYAGRLGENTFCIVLPHTDAESAAACMERLRKAVERSEIDVGPETNAVRATLSCGVAARTPETPSLARLLEAADRALYRAKRAGGNRVAIADDA